MSKNWELFKKVHEKKPQIYEEFKKATFKLIKAGVPRYSADGIMHVVRFLTVQTMHPDSNFKISNNTITFYARLFVRDFPQHKDFFRYRVLKSDQFNESWFNELEEEEEYII